MFYNKVIRASLALLNKKHRLQAWLLLPLLLFQSLLDVLSIASFVPMAMLIVRPETLRTQSYFIGLYSHFSFESERTFVLTWTASLAAFFLIKHFITLLITRVKMTYVFAVSTDLSTRALDHFINLSYAEYHERKSSNEYVKIAQFPTSFANNILLGLTTLFTEGLILLILFLSLLVYDWHSVTFLALLLVPAVLFYRAIRKSLRAIDRSLEVNYPELVRHSHQFFENFIEINLYKRQRYFIDKIQEINHRLHQSHIAQAILQANSFRIFETTAAVGLCILILYSLTAGLSPDITVILLGLYAAAGIRAIPSLNRIFVALLQIKSNEHVLAALTQIKPSNETKYPDTPVNFSSSLELRNIVFSFPGHKPVLWGVNLAIVKGHRIALTGGSGAGKTTLFLIVMRFLHESTGAIIVDGHPLSSGDTLSWRKLIAYVPQHPILIDGSVSENIAFGIDPREVDNKRIKSLLDALGLGAWLNQLPAGMNERFGDHGIKLSGGQRQRLAIARALYSNAEILLLDEVTSQVDSATENEVHQALDVISRQGKTLIMITHRESTLAFFDRVVRLDAGVIQDIV